MFNFKLYGKTAVAWDNSLKAAMNNYTELMNDPRRLRIEYNQRRMKNLTGHSDDWTGFESEAAFITMMKEGDRESATRIRKMSASEVILRSTRRRPRRSDIGEELDITAVYRGETEKAWRTTHREHAEGGTRYVTLVLNHGANGNVSASSLAYRGLAALKIADTLTDAGYFVRIVSGDITQRVTGSGGYNCIYLVTLKDFDEYLNVPKLASVICRAGFFRRVGFSACIAAADSIKEGCEVSYGLGTAEKMNEGVWTSTYPLIDDSAGNTVAIPEANNEAACARAIEQTLKRFA